MSWGRYWIRVVCLVRGHDWIRINQEDQWCLRCQKIIRRVW